jgi:hypothetical protein
MKYMDIDKTSIPYEFQMDIAEDEFTFVIDYNKRFDFFTMDLYKNDILIIKGEKIVYGRALFGSYPDDSVIPEWPIIPFDEAGKETRVGWDQLNETVFLFLGDPDE